MYISDLLRFLNDSPVNFLAAKTIEERLKAAGFRRLDPRDAWDIRPGDRCYMVKNDSAVFAFVAGSDAKAGFHIISAHSDSPGFRIKPNAETVGEGNLLKLNTEVYGGPILSTWFDRPLSVAGRVIVKSDNPLRPRSICVKIDRPLLTIANLAIHFNRAVNDGYKISKQQDTLPIAGIVSDELEKGKVLLNLIAEKAGVPASDILDFDLSLYDTTPACTFGLNNELISSGRLDDLSMVHAALTALIETASVPTAATRVMAIFDNEETGSGTKQGAASPVLVNALRRITARLGGAQEDFYRALASTFLISADNAHAFHPNYSSKYDPTTHAVLGGGPTIKINANCKYMTDADTAATFASICREAGVPFQYFVNHIDFAGGSTLGNILTSQMDIRGVDMGAPILAMHSCRETQSADDHVYTIKAFSQFFRL